MVGAGYRAGICILVLRRVRWASSTKLDARGGHHVRWQGRTGVFSNRVLQTLTVPFCLWSFDQFYCAIITALDSGAAVIRGG